MKKTFAVIMAVLLVLSLSVLVACNPVEEQTPTSKGSLTFVMPDGTPALAAAKILGTTEIGGYTVNAEIVAANTIATQIGGELADIVIAPTNAGASLINKGAPYKLVSVAVEGSLYLIGSPSKVGGNSTIVFDDLKGKRIASIGQNNTPDKVFKYIVDNTVGLTYDDENDTITFSDGATATIEWCADGPAAKVALLRENNPCDFAIVGEPAATAFGTPNGGGFSARMDLQALYRGIGNKMINFPQASLFVKTSLTEDKEFMSALFEALEDSKAWVVANPTEVTALLQEKGSTSTFPAPSIPRCSVVVTKANNNAVKEAITTYLGLMVPAVDWTTVDLFA
jgi:ABC-type nitrate/sulfonate/bicarbonate transport system substrate-binding protein